MKVAFQIGRMANNPEKILASRLMASAANIEIEARLCETSDELHDFDPDLAICVDPTISKLTRYHTLGIMADPSLDYESEKITRNVISWDSHMVSGKKLHQYLDDLSFGLARKFDIFEFHASCPAIPFSAGDGDRKAIAFLDSDRSRDQEILSQIPFVHDIKRDYDHQSKNFSLSGGANLENLRDYGIALCLHDSGYLKYDIQKMGVFDAIAASAVLITDDNDFMRGNFGDRVFYLENNMPAAKLCERINEIYDEIRSRPDLAMDMAREAHKVFSERFSLDRLLADIVETTKSRDDRHARKWQDKRSEHRAPRVDCIVRSGFRDAAILGRALASIASQSFDGVRVILVNNGDTEYVREVMKEFIGDLDIEEVVVPVPQGRSHSLWKGLECVKSEFFCILDDDDCLFPDHIQNLVDILGNQQDSIVAYGGSVRVWEGGAVSSPDDRESRDLAYFQSYDRSLLMQGINFIPSNAFLARASALEGEVLCDPELNALEDLWLMICLARKGDFTPSWRVSSEFYWRRNEADNISFDRAVFHDALSRVKVRLRFLPGAGEHCDASPHLSSAQTIAGLPSRKVDLLQKAPRYRGMAGHIDSIHHMDGQVEICGWGKWRNISDAQRLVFSGARGRVLTSEVLLRADVAEHMNDWSYYFSGFRVRLALDEPWDAESVAIFSADAHGGFWKIADPDLARRRGSIPAALRHIWPWKG